jgi:tetratricopeptide (TPR) repeat protein
VESEKVEEAENPSNESELPLQEEEKPEGGASVKEDSDTVSEVDDAQAVAEAAEWVQKIHKVSTLDSLWYERLGETYRILYKYNPAIEALTQATKFDNPHWTGFRSLALALADRNDEGDIALAVAEMEKVLDTLRKVHDVEENSEGARSNLIDNLLQMANWQTKLKNSEQAQACYQEILAADPDNMEANCEILNILLRKGLEERFRESLEILSKRKPKEAELSTLGCIVKFLGGFDGQVRIDNTIFGKMFLATQKTQLFDILIENLEDAIELARKQNHTFDLSTLLLQAGIALYHYDQREQKNLESALSLWAECGSLSSGNSSSGVQIQCKKAFRFTSFHYFQRAKASQDPSPHLEKLKQILSRQQIVDHHAKSYLGCYYAFSGDRDAAKKLFLDDFMTALALLSDDEEWNDYQGYHYFADILMYSGDYLNSLSAWSLIIPEDIDLPAKALDECKDELIRSVAQDLKRLIPDEVQTLSSQRETFALLIKEVDRQISELEATSEPESTRLEALKTLRTWLNDKTPKQSDREEKEIGRQLLYALTGGISFAPSNQDERDGPLRQSCDGKCGKGWKFANDVYCCKSCPDVQFCKDCRDKLVAGKLQIFICSPDHEWMQVPNWDDEEYAKVGRGKVKVGGTWDGEVRVGGEVVTIEAWLDSLRDEWGVPRAVASDGATAAITDEQ